MYTQDIMNSERKTAHFGTHLMASPRSRIIIRLRRWWAKFGM